MKLTLPSFEKSFRSAYRGELKRSAELRARVRRARRARARQGEIFRRLLVLLVMAVIFASFTSRVPQIEFGLALISLWAAGSVFSRAQQWFQLFYASGDLLALNLLPLSDQQIFRVQSRKFVQLFAWTALELTLLYAALAIGRGEPGPLLWLAPLLGLAQAGLGLALSLHCVVFLHMLPLAPLGGLLKTAAVFLLFTGPYAAGAVPVVIRFCQWFFPTGWLNYAAAQPIFHDDWTGLGLLLPIGAIAWAGIYSWQRLRAFYTLEGLELMQSPGPFPDQAEPASKGATEIHDLIGEGLFLRGLPWANAGWIERWISRLLKERDRVVLEFLVAENPQWTQSLRNSLWVLGAGAAVVYLFGDYGGLLIFFPAYLLATTALPLLGGEWRGLQQMPSGGVFLPAYAVYPLTFREMIRVMSRVNLVRTMAAAPLLLSFSLLAAWKMGHPLISGAEFCGKAFAIFLALQPVLILLPISKSTNDTSRMRWTWLILIPVVIVMLVLSVAAFFVRSAVPSLTLLGSIAVLSLAFHFLYRSDFNRGRFDLLSTRADPG